MNINNGFVLYETILTNEQKDVTHSIDLTIKTVRDRAIIYLDKVCIITFVFFEIHKP